MVPENPTEDEVRQELMRVPRAVTLGRVAETSVIKLLVDENDRHAGFTCDLIGQEGRLGCWESLCVLLAACKTEMRDEWVICGHVMLLHIWQDPQFVPVETCNCGCKGTVIYVGHIRKVSVYLSTDSTFDDYFYVGYGQTCKRGKVISSYTSVVNPILDEANALVGHAANQQYTNDHGNLDDTDDQQIVRIVPQVHEYTIPEDALIAADNDANMPSSKRLLDWFSKHEF